MSLQLIFVVETNKKCKSDWIYIKDTIDRFYRCDHAQLKLSPVYMDGRGKYKSKEKEISRLIKDYSVDSKAKRSKVIFCFDCDNYDTRPEDAEFLGNARQYCAENGYDFVWFCKDVESVYLGKKVDDKQKGTEAALFKAKKLIAGVEENRLSVGDYRANTSNILTVIDKYLSRK